MGVGVGDGGDAYPYSLGRVNAKGILEEAWRFGCDDVGDFF